MDFASIIIAYLKFKTFLIYKISLPFFGKFRKVLFLSNVKNTK
jgi:hypothetical protein